MKKMLILCLAGLAAAAFAAETAVELTRKDVVGWGPDAYYLTKPVVTVENGTAKVTCGEIEKNAEKPRSYQFSIRSSRTFKAGVKYTITFNVRSNMAVKKHFAFFQGHARPCPIFARTPITLPANTEKTFTLICTPKEDITVRTRIVSIHMPLKEGQTLEIGNVKIAEENAG